MQLVLDSELRVVAASQAFSVAFGTPPAATLNKRIGAVGNGEWDHPELHTALLQIFSHEKDVHQFELGGDFPIVGKRRLLISASRMIYANNLNSHISLHIEDITERFILESELTELLKQKDILLDEMTHRVSNSLQIIASILMLKARTVKSEETRRHLEEARHRVIAVATVQNHLHAGKASGEVGCRSYLSGLCDSLSKSLIGDDQSVSIAVEADAGSFNTDQAISVGLITTELVINAVKHAFPNGASGGIVVRYESGEAAWRLSVSDGGVGMATKLSAGLRVGLGTSILEALTRQLGGHLITSTNSPGTTVTLTVPRLGVGAAQNMVHSAKMGHSG
jgi:two-component sensor histidine kinase